MKTNYKKIALNGLLTSNPSFRLVLGCCPTLALTTAAFNGIGMGLAVTFVLVLSNLFISLLRNVVPKTVRIPVYILIIATSVTVLKMLLEKFIPSIYDVLGIYLPLITVNCIILGRAEAFASKHPILPSVCDGIFMGLGYTLAITLMGAFREILGKGEFFGIPLFDFSITFFSTSAGAFFTYGLFIAVFNYVYFLCEKRARKKHIYLHELKEIRS